MRIILCSICTMLTLLVFATNYYNAIDKQTITVPKYTVGVVLKAMDSEHWLAVRSSMQKAAKEHNLNLIVLYATDEAAYREQNKIITDLINNDIDALIISSCNISESSAYLNLAEQNISPYFPSMKNWQILPISAQIITASVKKLPNIWQTIFRPAHTSA